MVCLRLYVYFLFKKNSLIVPTMVPPPPVQVDNSSAIVFCEQKFAPGFNGGGTKQCPAYLSDEPVFCFKRVQPPSR